ncbi:MAG: 16S rRNA processing protein RimM [Deltaproteobacteria bacterium]|nr:16S rRNA processing protein RimM [Deltaproteobacteria bacterium]
MSKDKTIPIGRITGPHGIKGEVRFTPYGELEDIGWEGITVVTRQGRTPCKVTGARPHKDGYLLTIAGYATRNEAEGLTGAELHVDRSAMPVLEDGEYYNFELIGAQVTTNEGRDLGIVKGIIETGGNDVLEVDGPDGETLIPVIEQTILNIDVANGRITVHLMEGLEPAGKKNGL